MFLWWHSRALESRDTYKRVAAVKGIAKTRHKEALDLLLKMQSDESSDVREATATALGDLGGPGAVAPLVKMAVEEREGEVAQCALQALMRLDPCWAVGHLTTTLSHEESRVRQAAASVLRKIAWESLDPAIKARVAIVQGDWSAATSLGAAAIRPLLTHMEEGTKHGRREAADALARIGNDEAKQTLIRIVKDGDRATDAREVASWALRRYCWEELDDEALALAAIFLGDWTSVVQLGRLAIAPLANALQNAQLDVRIRIAKALGEIGNDEAVDVLANVLDDEAEDVGVRTVAARALGRIPCERSVSSLVSALAGQAWMVRATAAVCLERIEWQPETVREAALFAIARERWDDLVAIGEEAIDSLVQAIPFHSVGRKAAQVLVRIGPNGRDALATVLAGSQEDTAVMEVATTALAEVKDPRAIDPVKRMLKHTDMAVRQSAVWTLQRFGWEPANDAERAHLAIANDRWAEVRSLGAAAIESLLCLAACALAPAQTIEALEAILGKAPRSLSISQLHDLAALCDLKDSRAAGDARRAVSAEAELDCGKIRRAAKNELIRRGIFQ